jgi:hypothetical protein
MVSREPGTLFGSTSSGRETPEITKGEIVVATVSLLAMFGSLLWIMTVDVSSPNYAAVSDVTVWVIRAALIPAGIVLYRGAKRAKIPHAGWATLSVFGMFLIRTF